MKTVKIRNYRVNYEVKEFKGRKYISGVAHYVGKECRLPNSFYTGTQNGRITSFWDYNCVIPKYLTDKVEDLHSNL